MILKLYRYQKEKKEKKKRIAQEHSLIINTLFPSSPLYYYSTKFIFQLIFLEIIHTEFPFPLT